MASSSASGHLLPVNPVELPAHFLRTRNGGHNGSGRGVAWDVRRATIMSASPKTGLKGIRLDRTRNLETRRGTLLGAFIKLEAEQVSNGIWKYFTSVQCVIINYCA